MQSTIQFLVGNLGGKKTKERFETILEPLQAILQIAFLSYYPIGSKLSIYNNILVIQPPGYTQNVKRWYNNDKREDVYYLYNVFSRFDKFYKNTLMYGSGAVSGSGSVDKDTTVFNSSSSSYVNTRLYSLLHELAKTGINNLIRTYNQTDKIHILHTLQMYKGMLDSPELVSRLGNSGNGSLQHKERDREREHGGKRPHQQQTLSDNDEEDDTRQSLISHEMKPLRSSKRLSVNRSENRDRDRDVGGAGGGGCAAGDEDTNLRNDESSSSAHTPRSKMNRVNTNDRERSSSCAPPTSASSTAGSTSHPHPTTLDNIIDTSHSSHIDTIFIRITDLYSQDDFNIVYHTLLKIQNDSLYYMNYIEGLNKILEPLNIRIKKWIDENIVF